MTADRLYLDVPYAEKEAAKRAGARWDAGARRWYAGAEAASAALARWLVPKPPAGPSVAVRVYAMAQTCYRCARPTRCIVGVVAAPEFTTDPDGFVAVDECADALARIVSREELRRSGVGDLRPRRSRHRPEGYTANGCVHCDAIMGSAPLAEDVGEWLASGARITDLHLVATVPLPISVLV